MNSSTIPGVIRAHLAPSIWSKKCRIWNTCKLPTNLPLIRVKEPDQLHHIHVWYLYDAEIASNWSPSMLSLYFKTHNCWDVISALTDKPDASQSRSEAIMAQMTAENAILCSWEEAKLVRHNQDQRSLCSWGHVECSQLQCSNLCLESANC